ncbi:sensor histidine kinase [Actibacterium sp. XHP0104]|uniref:sensor histidine kinase n=1 Tax=Actibacterium sp. XHP0104 TaxID=2984335 RepID=UPI0021E7FB67|nr:ATP-binding protein [Actibacterium sp. XHP0104]MCV2880758.1 ATP-binding protein [Actibacterium sp. XHP0104]
MKRLWSIAIYLGLATAFTAGVWWFAYSSALDQMAERGRSDLSLASDRLVSQLQQYRELVVLMADHPVVAAVLNGQAAPEEAGELLLKVSDQTGALNLHLSDATGAVIASSNRKNGALPPNQAGKPSFVRAMQGALGSHHERTSETLGRSYIFAAPVFAGQAVPQGVITVDVNIWAIESAWSGDPHAVFFTDDAGVVFVTNRSELLLTQRAPAPDERLARYNYHTHPLNDFPPVQPSDVAGHEVWAVNGGPYLPARALHLSMPLPVIGITGEIMMDVAPAARLARLQAIVAAAVALVFGAVLVLLQQRRDALSHRLQVEEEAKAQLEVRVAERTRELSEANRALRHEVTERTEAEAALKRAQDELVQAGKLSALGKMSAGLSHELNQPLMAIQTFADNATQFMDMGAPDKAASNLGRISEMARRMGRIIRNLRAFARQESEPMTNVDLVAVVEAVLDLSETRLTQSGVELTWRRPPAPVWVRGGEVRLQQVLLNLVSNGLDAMAGQAVPRIGIAIEPGQGVVRLIVRDHGPGIAEPEKIFDPFYTTKEVGQSEGMGLGLSISYGLVQSFGGAIRGRNHPDGGAEFTVELTAAQLEDAA